MPEITELSKQLLLFWCEQATDDKETKAAVVKL
jgi:hypothetical protein